MLEWFLIPQMKRIGEASGDIRVELFDLRTSETVKGLIEHTLDIGIVRESAIVAPLKFRFVREVGYKLFVPKKEARKWRHLIDAIGDVAWGRILRTGDAPCCGSWHSSEYPVALQQLHASGSPCGRRCLRRDPPGNSRTTAWRLREGYRVAVDGLLPAAR